MSNPVEVLARAFQLRDFEGDKSLVDVLADDIFNATEHGERYSAILAAHVLRFIERAGYKVVPVEPTDAMRAAGGEELDNGGGPCPMYAAEVFRAMLAAAPAVTKE